MYTLVKPCEPDIVPNEILDWNVEVSGGSKWLLMSDSEIST